MKQKPKKKKVEENNGSKREKREKKKKNENRKEENSDGGENLDAKGYLTVTRPAVRQFKLRICIYIDQL
jgi:hypothetical protein